MHGHHREESASLLSEDTLVEKGRSVSLDEREVSVDLDTSKAENQLLSDDPLSTDGLRSKLRRRWSTFFSRSNAYEFTSSPHSKFTTALKRALFFLLPSYVQSRIRPELSRTKRIYPTAWLDGMRGCAALFVFFYHFGYSCHTLQWGYGYNGPKNQSKDNWHEWWRLPIIRLLWGGDAMVGVFFVVSGYVLSYKPLKQIRSRDYSALFDTLVSGTFRRGIRLLAPCALALLFNTLLAELGAYGATADVAHSDVLLTNSHEGHLKRQGFPNAIYFWFEQTFKLVNPFHFNQREFKAFPVHDLHLWTIPIELACSLLLFVTQIGVAKMKPLLRIPLLLVLAAIAISKIAWPMALFYSGFALAEIDMIRDERKGSAAKRSRSWKLLFGLLWAVVAFIGLFLMSEPRDPELTMFWHTLGDMIPTVVQQRQRFWTDVGAVVFAFAVSNTSYLKRLFDNRFSQYLGRISYALYFTHSWVIHTVGYTCFRVFWGSLGVETTAAREGGFLLTALIVIPFELYVADVFWRAIDEPCVKFARWLEGKCAVKQD